MVQTYRELRMEQAIRGALKISALWLPSGLWGKDHEDEARALSSMRRIFESALQDDPVDQTDIYFDYFLKKFGAKVTEEIVKYCELQAENSEYKLSFWLNQAKELCEIIK